MRGLIDTGSEAVAAEGERRPGDDGREERQRLEEEQTAAAVPSAASHVASIRNGWRQNWLTKRKSSTVAGPRDRREVVESWFLAEIVKTRTPIGPSRGKYLVSLSRLSNMVGDKLLNSESEGMKNATCDAIPVGRKKKSVLSSIAASGVV